jgi:hypothetical protein
MATIATKKQGSKSKKVQNTVVLSRQKHLRLCVAAAPVVQLKGKAAKALDKLVEEGMREYKAGKTTRIHSLADLD